ncbi:MAG: cytochrome c oxidase subunit II [Deltaproteobacteria bacterium]|jgi:cytochrome c oxidase subunit 2|nr:cytochrome c oxidase subunit II [Deltaproteobacteria bacterium]
MRRRIYVVAAAFMTAIMVSVSAMASSGQSAGHGAGGVPDIVGGWNHLWDEMLWDITIMGIIFGVITIYFLFRYRRRFPQQEGNQVKLSFAGMMLWALIPAFIFMADDLYLAGKTWALFNDYRNVPENSYEIKLESAMWSWNYTYPNGVEAMNDLRVPAGRPVVMRMTSRDVIHSFYLPDFKVKEDSMPGRVTYLWFYPKEPGEHVITCAEFCGVLHSNMRGTVIAMPEDEFNKWLAEEKANLEEGGA